MPSHLRVVAFCAISSADAFDSGGGRFNYTRDLRSWDMITHLASLKTVAVLGCFLALAGCSKKNTPSLSDGGLGGGGLNDSDGAGTSGKRARPGSKAEFQQEIGDRIYFIVDQSSLTQEGRDTLTRQAEWLLKYDNVTVQVEGHADERGTREYNISLSARRATETRNFLIQQGVPGSRVASIAYGKERPASLCDAEECWNQNRRAVTSITGGTR
jgi:peptidoglycan-associated lipoprotein